MRLRNPGSVAQVITTLQSLLYECENCRNGQDALQARDAYLRWVEKADAQYGSLFTHSALEDGLHSPGYWEIHRLRFDSPRPFPMIHREIRVQCDRIERVSADLQRLREFIERPGDLVVPDTSALVQGEYFEDFDWAGELGLSGPVRLIIPVAVLEELDQLKDRERGRAQKRARSVVRRLRELARKVPPGAPVPVRKGVTFEVLWEDGDHVRLAITDVEITEQALLLHELTGREVLLACADATMEFRARQAGLTVYDMPVPVPAEDRPTG